MVYTDHPAFEISNWGQTVWRYISIHQFLSILETESLWFTRSDMFEDPYEGRLPDENINELSPIHEIKLPEYMTVNAFRGTGKKKTSDWEYTNKRSEIEAYRRISFVNCWHGKEKEMDTMWRAHLDSDNGVVIKSTAKQLRQSFSAYKETDVYLGEVEYIDYRSEKIEDNNLLRPFLYKRDGFEQENEIRAIVTSLPTDKHPSYKGTVPGEQVPLHWEEQDVGFYVDIDIRELIEEVRISPTASSWLERTLSDVCSKYDLDLAVTQSSLSTDPPDSRWDSD